MLRVGVIGCGSIAKQRHGYEYFHNSDVEIRGFYDLIPERAQALVDLYGGKVYAGVDELLADSEIDAVSVCMANAFHAEISIKALKAGKHVLCEKPMAVSLEECEAMAAAARKSGKRLMIGHNQRLAPAHKKAKEILASPPSAIRGRRCGAWTRAPIPGSSRKPAPPSAPWLIWASTRST